MDTDTSNLDRVMGLAHAVMSWDEIPGCELTWFREAQRHAVKHFGNCPELLGIVGPLQRCLEEYPAVQAQYAKACKRPAGEQGRRQAFQQAREFEAKYRPLVEEVGQAYLVSLDR